MKFHKIAAIKNLAAAFIKLTQYKTVKTLCNNSNSERKTYKYSLLSKKVKK